MISNHKFFHWLYYQQGKRQLINLCTGLFIWLFLGLTLPFGLYNNNLSSYLQLLLFLLVFGLVWIAVSYSTDYIARYLFSIKIDKNYKIDFWVHLLKIFLLVHTSFLIRSYLCDWSCMDGYEYLELWFACVLMLALVYVPFSLYARYKFFHKMVGVDNQVRADQFELQGEGKERLRVFLNQIIYIKSDDNYVDIVIANDKGKHQTLVFRARLKAIAAQLSAHSQFVRIHRSFLVNLRYVRNLEKKGIVKVSAEDLELELPVSGKYQAYLADLFRQT